MQRTLLLLQFAIWATGTQALYPRLPEQDEAIEQRDVAATKPVGLQGFVTFKMTQTGSSKNKKDESITNKVSRIAHDLARKYGSELPSRTTAEDATLVDRENKYSVVSPTPPTQSDSAGVYQDGTDFSYFIQADLGSAATPMYMLIDTGASTTWVMGSGCTSDACTTHNTFGPEDSKTLQDTGTPFSVEYGSGDVSGHVITDSMKVAGMSVTYSFGLTNVTSSQFTSFPFDGILGLSRSGSGNPNFLDALKDAKLINTNVFAVSLARNSDGGNDGEISFGAIDKAKYTGDVTYTSTTDSASWVIPMDDVTVGGKSAGVKDTPAYIDTGTTYAFAPPADVAAMYKMIPDSESSDDGVTWTMPCDTTASVAFTFSGQSFTLSSKDFLSAPGADNRCTGNIFGMDVVSGAWLLGDMFLKNVYTVFDLDGSRIGFASKPTGTQASTSTTALTTTVATITSENGATTLTTITSASAQTSPPPLGFTGGHDTSSSGTTNPTATADAATTASHTASSSGDRPEMGRKYVSIACIISIIAMVV
ncbi:aspartic peptidase domain-containing protein [Xylariales sp. AK1849]|nr:aspartic peptidase domain-containing protein [Xylariales sp. AK1849]